MPRAAAFQQRTSQSAQSMEPSGSTSLTPLSRSGLWEAVITIPVSAEVATARAATRMPHLWERGGGNEKEGKVHLASLHIPIHDPRQLESLVTKTCGAIARYVRRWLGVLCEVCSYAVSQCREL